MLRANKREPLILLVGDVCCLFVSLWLSLFLRTFDVPDTETLLRTSVPWLFIFAVTVLSFFIAGLYDKHRTNVRKKIPELLINAEIANSVIAIIFFYFTPIFGVAPKTILFIYILVSFSLLFCWRILSLQLYVERYKEKALLVVSGQEAIDLEQEINNNPRYSFVVSRQMEINAENQRTSKEELLSYIKEEHIALIIINSRNEWIMPLLPGLYDLAFAQVRFLDFYAVYEDVFDRLPVSMLNYSWFLENISLSPKTIYDILKRITDIALAVPIGLVSLLVYPFVYLAIKIEDRGNIFFRQERVGENGSIIRIVKFRSMSDSSNVDITNDSQMRVTRVGAFLRKTRIDELPQIWNVLKGDVSLIGPRPEIPALAAVYTQEIPYYSLRYLIKPGLSGWAQLYHDNHPHHGTAIDETKEKISYDLFYIKNRSFALDLIIILKTIKTLLSQEGI